jgi:hypothetical protein
MRQRVLLALTWVIATAAATGVGLAATQTVGDVIRGTGPVGPTYEPPAVHRPTTTDSPVRAIVEHVAVRLEVQCTGRTAVLLTVAPAPGWRLQERENGPDEDVDVLLTRDDVAASIEIYCNQGRPRAVFL